VKLLSADKESNERVVSLIEEKAGQLDVVIANAGNSVSDNI
jgi:NADP-dependent 3-hydroxy acid dehydrogenase YdfG